VGKRARKPSAALVSRSGLWVIGGALVFSVAVLAWALQGDSSSRPTHLRLPAMRATHPAPRGASRRAETTVVELATRLPTIGDYGPLLQDNVFQPRVIPRQAPSAAKHPPAKPQSAIRNPQSKAGPEKTDTWHDWKFNGLAQLDQQTYALMDQPTKKESRFVKVGDHLEDAIVERVAENEIALREAGGSIARIQRVDAMAELLRSVHTASSLPRGAAPAPAATPGSTGVSPASAMPGGIAVPSAPTAPSGQILPPAATAADDASQGRRRGRGGRRSRQSDGAGFTGEQ
jgi:hypothetical protein